eukprot:TRINITY_DN13135_c0_g1_i1.p1 TRINITY_DN13135_c0_g1~~TRINITY_DN13135_c0_g1_i1.p1  ORF type:complete len:317 (+),score=47.96 TRINITY_DN13135_c0_g1_i1:68-1018(+)
MSQYSGCNLDLSRYLERIGFEGQCEQPTYENLRKLVMCQASSVPFEIVDMHRTQFVPISIELPAIYDKIVIRRRGGYCYEANGLFSWCLSQLGYHVQLLHAFVARLGGVWADRPTHLCLRVTPCDVDTPFLVDTGYSWLTPVPVPWLLGEHEVAPHVRYRWVEDTPPDLPDYLQSHDSPPTAYALQRYIPVTHEDGEIRFEWTNFILTVHPQPWMSLADFDSNNQQVQRSQGTLLYKKLIVSRNDGDGAVRHVLAGPLYYQQASSDGHRTNQMCETDAEVKQVLREVFGIELSVEEELLADLDLNRSRAAAPGIWN